jgi:hypothetical protein
MLHLGQKRTGRASWAMSVGRQQRTSSSWQTIRAAADKGPATIFERLTLR